MKAIYRTGPTTPVPERWSEAGDWEPMPKWHPAYWLLRFDLRRREFEDPHRIHTFWTWARSTKVARQVLFSKFAPADERPWHRASGGRKAKI